jgi:3-isopropylmalate dehydrogenase
MRTRTHYTVACLTGHGIGPEVMVQACRVVDAASGLHGYTVDEHHVPFAADALMRFGHPFPPSSRRAVLAADAVLVAAEGGDALVVLEEELDLRASIVRIRTAEGIDLSLLAPLRDDAWAWTLERAFSLARDSRARVTLVGVDGRWDEAAAEVEARHDGLEVERLELRDAVRRLVFTPERFDVVVTAPEHAGTSAEIAACQARSRVAAWGRLAASGPSVFGAAHGAANDIAGQGVADPRSMVLAAALMLGEGLGERSAAATVASAVGRAGVDAGRPSTSGLGDTLLAQLPLALANSEFYREVAV